MIFTFDYKLQFWLFIPNCLIASKYVLLENSAYKESSQRINISFRKEYQETYLNQEHSKLFFFEFELCSEFVLSFFLSSFWVSFWVIFEFVLSFLSYWVHFEFYCIFLRFIFPCATFVTLFRGCMLMLSEIMKMFKNAWSQIPFFLIVPSGFFGNLR